MRAAQFLLALCVGGGLFAGAPSRAADDLQVQFFEKKIRPVLVKHCYECHSAESKKPKGSLLLDTRAGIRRGGDSGPAVVPGQVDESLLIEALRYASFEMPPKGKLPETVIADFEKWIRLGAADPRDGERIDQPANAGRSRSIDWEAARQFWSFRPPEEPAIPDVEETTWPRTVIDRFILARLEAEGLQPARDAHRRSLIRRLYFDLIGLPPSPQEIEDFVGDDSPDALARVVDGLLASPHFGERWGRHWLDVARFAESSGGGRTRIFHNAWRYRDYVTSSFNRDKPFPQFIAEQIAGDLLTADSWEQRREQLSAIAFLALGPINYELQDKELLRMEVVDEQIDVVGRAFLGLSLGCARCHDHKFDPISTADYYALAGIFKSTKTLIHANVSNPVQRPLPVDAEHQAALEKHRRATEPLEKKIKTTQAELKRLTDRLSGSKERVDVSKLAGIVMDNADAEVTGDWARSTSVRPFLGDCYLHDRNTGNGEMQVTYRPELPEEGMYEVRVSYTAAGNRAQNAAITVRHADGEKTVRIDQRKEPPIDGLFLSLGRFRFSRGQTGAVVISNRDTNGHTIADAVQFLPARVADELASRGRESPDHIRRRPPFGRCPPTARLKKRVGEVQERLKKLQTELESLEKRAPPAPPAVMAVQEEQSEEIGDCRICIRGNLRNLGREVPRGFLTVLAPGKPPKLDGDESGRLQLARWIGSADNPLTARVMVNRIWHHLFGRGIVATTDNFGMTGDRPSHPALLDWLAVRFMRDGWSIKGMIRQIVLSRAYQLASRPRPSRERQRPERDPALDPDNRLLSHQNRRRLDAEALRDAMLVVSGRLDPTLGGPTVPPSAKSEFDHRFRSRRRSVYVPVFRNRLHELFAVFDFADPNIVVGRRSNSTLPTQALYLMNSPFVMDQARHAARALLAKKSLDEADRIDLAYRRALGRPPSDSERKLAQDYFRGGEQAARKQAHERQLQRWANFYQALLGSIDFRYVY